MPDMRLRNEGLETDGAYPGMPVNRSELVDTQQIDSRLASEHGTDCRLFGEMTWNRPELQEFG